MRMLRLLVLVSPFVLGLGGCDCGDSGTVGGDGGDVMDAQLPDGGGVDAAGTDAAGTDAGPGGTDSGPACRANGVACAASTECCSGSCVDMGG